MIKCVVDIDKNTRKLFETIKKEGDLVFTAEDGMKAMEILDTNYINLIDLDSMMLNIDGYEFAKELRESFI